MRGVRVHLWDQKVDSKLETEKSKGWDPLLEIVVLLPIQICWIKKSKRDVAYYECHNILFSLFSISIGCCKPQLSIIGPDDSSWTIKSMWMNANVAAIVKVCLVIWRLFPRLRYLCFCPLLYIKPLHRILKWSTLLCALSNVWCLEVKHCCTFLSLCSSLAGTKISERKNKLCADVR